MADVNSSRMISDSFKAGETIPAFAAVSATGSDQIINTNWPDFDSVSNFLGIALNSGYAGADIEVCLFGVVNNPTWNFMPMKPVFLTYSGMLTQENPGQLLKKIGKAITAHKLFVNSSDLIKLSS